MDLVNAPGIQRLQTVFYFHDKKRVFTASLTFITSKTDITSFIY